MCVSIRRWRGNQGEARCSFGCGTGGLLWAWCGRNWRLFSIRRRRPIRTITAFTLRCGNIAAALFLAAIERADGNVAEAARALKLHPVYLHRLITNLGLRQSESD